MELRLLGPVQVLDDEGHVVDVRGDKPKRLLALLGLRAGEVVSIGRIVEELWGDQELRDPLNAVQVLVSKLRRPLRSMPGAGGGQLIETNAAGYRLDAAPAVVDAARFEGLALEARALLSDGAVAMAAEKLREALDLWRGRALEDFEDGFVRADRTRLEELRISSLELRIEADLMLGRHDEVTAELAVLVAEHPLRERLRAQQMLALHRAGRQADALRAYQEARTVLVEELGLEPGPDLRRLEAAIVARDPALDLAVEGESPAIGVRRTGNLPVPISSFVGRVEERETLARLVGSQRMVTVVGPGGAGKTRLALEVAAATTATHRDGVWLIELAPLRDARHVAPAVATALGLDDDGRLEPFLADKDILLVVDNCEHVVDEAAIVVERLLRAGAGVKALATSRERLGVSGEVLWLVPPLAAADASSLFLERAEAAGLQVAPDDAASVEQICRRLDGLPLAVELAAARTRSLSLDDIAERIDDRFRLLTTGGRTAAPRQQTLKNLVDWSYDLLFADEQRVFRRLSVFAGGFDTTAVEAVCAGDDVAVGDVVDLVGRLVDKSLVSVAGREQRTRYRLLQTLVDYGRGRLIEAGEHDATRDRHLRWMVRFAAEAEPALRATDQPRWIRRLALEQENARAALDWARHRGRTADAVALAGGLAYGWYITGAVQEGQDFIAQALGLKGESAVEHRAVAGAWGAWLTQIGSGATSDAVDRAERAVVVARGRSVRGFCTAAVVASLLRAYRGVTVEASELIEEAAAVLAAEPDRWLQAFVDWVRSGLVLKMGDAERAAELLRRSITGFSEEGDRYGTAIASIRLGELAELRGDFDEAISATTLAYDATISAGPGANASILATRLGNLAALQGRFDDAAAWHATGLSRARELVFPGPAAQALSGMAVAAVQQGRVDDGETLHREALDAYEGVGSVEGVAFTYACLGMLATSRGDAQAAADLHGRSLMNAARGHERRAMALAVEGLAGVRALVGDGAEAAVLLGVAAELRGGAIVVAPWLQAERDRVVGVSKALVGESVYDAAYRSGGEEAETVVARLVSETGRSF